MVKDPTDDGLALEGFAQRFALATFEREGVLVDLREGGYYRLNATAARVCASLAEGATGEDVARTLAARFALTLEAARADVRAVLGALREERARTRHNPVRFEPQGAWLAMYLGEALAARLDPEGRCARLEEGACLAADREQRLLWVVPHLLALQGQPVLHASAVVRDGRARAFAGASGAGKTTTARAFERAGHALASEDLLPLHAQGDGVCVSLHDERGLRAWVRERGAHAAEEIDARDLRDALAGPRVPLAELWLLDAARREGEAARLAPVGPADALIAVLENGFVESASPRVWRQLLGAGATLARATAVARAVMPRGLDALERAARGL